MKNRIIASISIDSDRVLVLQKAGICKCYFNLHRILKPSSNKAVPCIRGICARRVTTGDDEQGLVKLKGFLGMVCGVANLWV